LKVVTVKDILLQFDLDCDDSNLELKVIEALKEFNWALVRLFPGKAPTILNKNNKISITTEDF